MLTYADVSAQLVAMTWFQRHVRPCQTFHSRLGMVEGRVSSALLLGSGGRLWRSSNNKPGGYIAYSVNEPTAVRGASVSLSLSPPPSPTFFPALPCPALLISHSLPFSHTTNVFFLSCSHFLINPIYSYDDFAFLFRSRFYATLFIVSIVMLRGKGHFIKGWQTAC